MHFQFPWIVSIGYFVGDVWNHICSGNIVSENAVLTSLDCGSEIFRDPKVQIKMGAQFLNGQEDSDTVSIYDISLVLKGVPLRPDKDKHAPDFAYVYTQGNITTNARTRPICLFGFDSKTSTPALNNFIWAGWNTSSGEMSNFHFNSTLRLQCQDRGNCPFEFEDQNLLKSLQTDLDGSGIFKIIDTDENDHTFYEMFGISDHNGKITGKLGSESGGFFLLFFMYFMDFLRHEVESGKDLKAPPEFSIFASTMNPTYEGGTSLIHLAARLGNRNAVENICEFLERNHQSIIPTDDIGLTPLHEAYLAGHYTIARYILEKMDDDLFLQISLTDQNVTAVISQVNEMIDLTERGNFTGDPMEILNMLIFFNDDARPSADTYTEMIARRYIRELESILGVADPTRELLEGEIAHIFHKLSLIQNLTQETMDLITKVGTLVISKLAEDPGPTRKPTENESFPKIIYYVLKVFSNGPDVSIDVITNLKEIGMCLIH